MCPGQHRIDASHLRVESIVGHRADLDGTEPSSQHTAQLSPQSHRLIVTGNRLAVADIHFLHGLGQVRVDVGGDDDDGAEKIALAAFINPHMGLAGLGVQHLIVADHDALEDIGFQDKRDEFFSTLALNQAFTAGVEVDAAVVTAHRDAGVGDRRLAVVSHAEDFCQLGLLGRGELKGKGSFLCHDRNIP